MDEVSVLFSEPKIPQLSARTRVRAVAAVSVLFSEPKIPQFFAARLRGVDVTGFSALQRAENSSISMKRKRRRSQKRVSVLFSEPKIPQSKEEEVVRTVIS